MAVQLWVRSFTYPLNLVSAFIFNEYTFISTRIHPERFCIIVYVYAKLCVIIVGLVCWSLECKGSLKASWIGG